MSADRLSACDIHRLRWGAHELGWKQHTTLVVLELRTANGITGLGEASLSGDDTKVIGDIAEIFETSIKGKRISEIPNLVVALARRAADCGSFVEATAASALEQALWDVRGQVLGLPIHALLGGARHESVPLYANINRIPAERRNAQGFALEAAAAVEFGYGAVKCAPFDGVTPTGPDDGGIVEGIARVAAIREAIGDDAGLLVDCHGRLGARRTLELLPQFNELRLKWLEEPVITNRRMWFIINRRAPEVPADGPIDLTGLDAIAAAGSPPLAGGELDVGLESYLELFRHGALRYVMPDVKHCGGIGTTSLVAYVAASLRVGFAPHNPSGPVATLASAHAAAVAPSLDCLETAWRELLPETHALITPPLQVASGRLHIPSAPGLGARLDHDVVDRLRIPAEDAAVTGAPA